jgi:hypothetical protein
MQDELTPEEVAALKRLAPYIPVALAVLQELNRDPEPVRQQTKALLTLSELSPTLSAMVRRAENIRFALSSLAWLVGGFIMTAMATGALADLLKWIRPGGSPPSQP